MKEYSIKKGLVKGVLYALSFVGMLAIFAGISEMTIWGFLENNLKPILGTMTFGVALRLAQNYVKFHMQE